jgi:hypothetical protein
MPTDALAPAELVSIMEMVPVGRIRRKRAYQPELCAWATPATDQPNCEQGALVTVQLFGRPVDGRCVAHALRSPHDGKLWDLHVPAGGPALSDKEIKRLTKLLWRSTGAHGRKA